MSAAYKSASELGITEKEREALLWVREKLARGDFKKSETGLAEELHQPGNFFNMDSVGDTEDCGTVCCIGGWMHVHMAGLKPDANGIYKVDYDSQSDYVRNDHSLSLHDLFFPESETPYNRLTPEQALGAIESFLKTAETVWDVPAPEQAV